MNKNIILILTVMLISFGIRAENTDLQVFPFVFKESTGDNKFVFFNKTLHPVRLFESGSNKRSLLALNALKANIIYPNSSGNKIFLLGSYNESNASFSLSAWFIMAPFLSQDLVDESEIPQQFKINSRDELLEADFSRLVVDPSIFIMNTDKNISEIVKLQKE